MLQIPDPDGGRMWRVEVGPQSRRGLSFYFSARNARREERFNIWVIDEETAGLRRELGVPLGDATQLARGFARLYRRRFREALANDDGTFQIDRTELALHFNEQPGGLDEIDWLVREVEDIMFALAVIRTQLERLDPAANTYPRLDELPFARTWHSLKRVFAASNDPFVVTALSGLTEFHHTYEQLGDKLPGFPDSKARERTIAQIIDLEVLGTQLVWTYLATRGPAQGKHTPEAPALQPQPTALSLQHIEISNIRCIEHLSLSLERDGTRADWLLILGDNASGKSTLLRAIALGLCHESDAAALLKAIPGPLIRHGAGKATIALTLSDDNGEQYRSLTEITVDTNEQSDQETLRRIGSELPAERLFVCGYGTARTRTADQSYDSYSRAHAVRSLFGDTALQNPELVYRRQDMYKRALISRKLVRVLMLEMNRASVALSARGLDIVGPWAGNDSWTPTGIDTLSDGYRSTAQWVTDLIGWLAHAGRFEERDMAGIVLIDELEQHLHPRWQRHIISKLSQEFPSIQFIATTHTPMLALGLADQPRGWLLQMQAEGRNRTAARRVDPHTLRGLRADQVLTSRATFALPTTRSPGSADRLARYTELMETDRTPDQERELAELRVELETTLVLGETPYERRVERAVRKALDELAAEPVDEARREELEMELRRQLGEFFASGEKPA